MRPSDAATTATVPDAVSIYLGHVADGTSIRAIARERGVHASTILRSVRRVEARRDDPLVDEALGLWPRAGTRPTPDAEGGAPSQAAGREERRVLRRLCETGAVLAIAPGMENAVVVREAAGRGRGHPDGGHRARRRPGPGPARLDRVPGRGRAGAGRPAPYHPLPRHLGRACRAPADDGGGHAARRHGRGGRQLRGAAPRGGHPRRSRRASAGACGATWRNRRSRRWRGAATRTARRS